MKKFAKYTFFISLASFYPMIVLAGGAPLSDNSCVLADTVTFKLLVDFIICNINTAVIPLIFGLAVVMFIWGVVQFVIHTDEEAKKEQGRQFMLWGIIALAVMVGVWGLVHIFTNTFNITFGIPQVKSQ